MVKLCVVVLSLVLVGCGGGESLDLENRDPRCVSACKPATPAIEGTGEICDTASQVSCLDECEARIAGTMTTCASCLVEDACLTTGSSCRGDDGSPEFCSNGTCTTEGPNGSCTYPVDDRAAYEDCRRQVDPEREVSCRSIFRATSECADLCAS